MEFYPFKFMSLVYLHVSCALACECTRWPTLWYCVCVVTCKGFVSVCVVSHADGLGPMLWGQRKVSEGTWRKPGVGQEEVQYILLFAYKGFALLGRSHGVQKRRWGGVEGEWVSGQILVIRVRLDFAGWAEDILHLRRFFWSICKTR